MDFISLNVENHTGIVTMNKPPRNNFNLQMYKELGDTFRSINKSDDIWVAILRAEGKVFSTGNDVNEFVKITDTETAAEYTDKVAESVGSVYTCRVPLIGAVQGKALGIGLIFASCCDILIAAENTKFGIPEVKVSLVGAACFISRMLPQQLHRYMSFSGDMMTAEEMKHFGAVLKVVPLDRLSDQVQEIASRLLSNPPLTLRGFKAAINTNENARLLEKYAVESSYTKEMPNTEDAKEAIVSFFEKRAPVYKGR